MVFTCVILFIGSLFECVCCVELVACAVDCLCYFDSFLCCWLFVFCICYLGVCCSCRCLVVVFCLFVFFVWFGWCLLIDDGCFVLLGCLYILFVMAAGFACC